MKPLATFILLLFVGTASAQVPLTYSRVIEVDSSIKQKELFERAAKWFMYATGSGKGNMVSTDKDNFQLIAKMSVPYESKYAINNKETKGFLWYTLTVSCKDGRYKYEFTNFIHEGSGGNRFYDIGMIGVPEKWEPISFGLLTKDSIAPERLWDIEGRKWATLIWKEMRAICRSNSISLIESLHGYMQTPVATKKDDW